MITKARSRLNSSSGRVNPMLLLAGGLTAAVALGIALWTIGSRWWLIRELERQHPAVSVADKHTSALQAALKALPHNQSAAVLLAAPLHKLVPSAAPGFATSVKLEGASLTLSNAKLTGSDQRLMLETQFILEEATQGVTVKGRIAAAAFPSIATATNAGALEVTIAPIIQSWHFDEVKIKGLRTNLAPVVNALSYSLQASAEQISQHLGSVKIPIGISSSARSLKFINRDNTETTVPIPAYQVERAPLLVSDDSLFIMLQFEGAAAVEKAVEGTPRGPSMIEELKSEFSRIVERDFSHGISSPKELTIEVASKFLEQLGNIVANPKTAGEVIQESVNSNSRRLESAAPASIGFFVSAQTLRSVILDRIAASAAELQRNSLGIISEPAVEIGQQFISMSAHLNEVSVGQNVSLSGRVSGIVTPNVTADSIRINTAFERLDINNLIVSGWQVDPLKIILLLRQSNEVLLPSINALIKPDVIKLQTLNPGKARFLPKTETTSTETKNSTITTQYLPSEISLPQVALGDPVVLMDQYGLRAMVSMAGIQEGVVDAGAPLQRPPIANAPNLLNDLPRGIVSEGAKLLRLLVGQSTPISTAPLPVGDRTSNKSVTFDEYKQQFDKKWVDRSGADLTLSTDVFAFVRKETLSEFVNAAWPPAGVQASITFNETSKLKNTHHRIGHIDTNIDCKRGGCNRNTCGRTENCSRRDSCPRAGCGREPGECSYSCEKCWRIGSYKDCKDDPVCLTGRTICNAGVESRILACNAREESAKAECNLRAEAAEVECNARQEASIANCNLREETALVDCNIRAEAALGACNIKKEAMIGLSNLGEIGNTEGSMFFAGGGSIALMALRVDSAMQSVMVSANVRATGVASAEVKFTPHGGVGHILGCREPIWLRPVIRADVDSGLGVSAAASFIEREADGEKKLVWAISIPEISVRAKLSPAPADALLINNPEVTVVCPFIATAAGVTSLLGKGLTVLGGEQIFKTIDDQPNALVQFGAGIIQVKAEAQIIDVDIPEFAMLLGSKLEKLKPAQRKSVLVFELKRVPPPISSK